MATQPEPSVNPEYLIQAVRSFVAVTTLPAGATTPEQQPDWETAGCLVWDAVALPDDAAFLLQELPELPDMLAATLAATAAAESWRSLEIGIGVVGNLACHSVAKPCLLEQQGLPELLLDRLLWVDDAASLAELCRCLAALLSENAGSQAVTRWWVLLLREETLGRLVWVLENTMSTTLLERVLNLLSILFAAPAAAAAASGDRGHPQFLPQLLALDLLQLVASVLSGWLSRLQAEQQQFAGDGGGSGGAAGGPMRGGSSSANGWDCGSDQQGQVEAKVRGATPGAGVEQQVVGDTPESAAGFAAADIDAAAARPNFEAAQAPADPAAAAAAPAVAAEVSEAAALEALGLLEVLATDPDGEQALEASASVQNALARMIAASENRGMQGLSMVLLAGLEGSGTQLLLHPPALVVVLERLQRASQELGASRAADAGGGSSVGRLDEEELQAAWALCSALARELSRRQQAGGGERQEMERRQQRAVEGRDTASNRIDAACVDEVVGLLLDNLDVLCQDWGSSSASSLAQHQAYLLARLPPLLAKHSEAAGARLQAALERCRVATE